MRKYIILFACMLALASCSTLKITSNYDGEAKFSEFKTYSYYGWNEKSTNINSIDRQYIERAFAREFNARGMTFDTTGNGDVVVSLLLVINSEKQVQAYSNYYGGSPYGLYQPGWGWGYGYGSPYAYGGVTYKEYNYLKGTLVCDVFDREAKTLAWQGVASKELDGKIDKREEKINAVISRLMERYPVQKIKN